ncbi:MAG: helix-turn-helix domain-containing protein [Rhizobiales bacterium]|nr:helix-turn-helix domain-containing protein [Hyphomicrobiales bacterium]
MTKLLKLGDWEANLQKICGNYKAIASKNKRHVHGFISCFVKNGLEVAEVNCDLDYINRTVSDIGKDNQHQFFLLEQKQGHCLISQRNVDVYLNPGDFALMDSSYPVSMHYDGTFSSQISHHLPAEAMLSLRHSNSTNLYLAADTPKAQILRGYLDNIFNDDRDAWLDNEKKMALQNLVTISFVGDARNETEEDILFKQAIIYIKNNFTDSELKPILIANNLGVSLRNLQKCFQKYGKTLGSFICETRLNFACQMLSINVNSSKKYSISNLAFESGFGDLSYFNRRFKQRYGCSPTAYKDYTLV